MHDDDFDLDWLRAARPAVAAPPAELTGRVRRVLVAYAEAEGPVVGPERAVRRRRRRPRAARLLAPVVLAAVTVAILVAALPAGHGHGHALDAPHVLAPAEAQAAPLVRLARRVRQLPLGTGDATLVEHTNKLADGSSFTGADLWLDDGRYYYAATAPELKQDSEANDQTDDIKPVLDAALDANSLSPAAARARMIAVDGMPTGPSAPPPAGGPAAKALERKEAFAKRDPWPPAGHQSIVDNYIWMACNNALEAGAGRPQIRAGVLKVLSTIAAVKLEDGSENGTPTLTVVNTDFPQGYQEALTLNAATGVPLRFVGGTAGKSPSVIVTYTVSRVTAADVLGT